MPDSAPVDNDEAHPVWSCRRKKQYPSQDIAERMANKIIAASTDGGAVRAYGCRHCGQWHIGSVPGVPRAEVIAPRRAIRRVATGRGSGGSYGSTRRRHKRERFENNYEDGEDS